MEENLKIPKHVAIIMDGNGRWAQERGLSRSKGHDAGFQSLKDLSQYILEKGVEVLSVYAFSTENFKRSKEEVDYLMNLFVTKFKKEKKMFMDKNIKVIFSGRKEPLRDDVWQVMQELTEATKDNTKGILNLCLNYGGQQEIVDASLKIHEDILNGKLSKEDIDEKSFFKYLYNELPPIDFLIRTSGEERVSNFMLFQISYAEFYFPKMHFPAFTKEDFDDAILFYNKRDRRFGGINKK